MKAKKINGFRYDDFEEKYGEYVLDCVEGNLLDNYITENGEGTHFVYIERVITTWTSGWWMYEFNNVNEAWDFWYGFLDKRLGKICEYETA